MRHVNVTHIFFLSLFLFFLFFLFLFLFLFLLFFLFLVSFFIAFCGPFSMFLWAWQTPGLNTVHGQSSMAPCRTTLLTLSQRHLSCQLHPQPLTGPLPTSSAVVRDCAAPGIASDWSAGQRHGLQSSKRLDSILDAGLRSAMPCQQTTPRRVRSKRRKGRGRWLRGSECVKLVHRHGLAASLAAQRFRVFPGIAENKDCTSAW